jgi:hypothetical protein
LHSATNSPSKFHASVDFIGVLKNFPAINVFFASLVRFLLDAGKQRHHSLVLDTVQGKELVFQ